MNYKTSLILDTSGYSESVGYVNEVALGRFDAGLDMGLFAHDMFEHWFEETKFFRTKELSYAGECVAMGIRSYLDDHSDIVRKFMSYNTYYGVEWNSWHTCLGMITDHVKGYSDSYALDFNYLTLKGYKPHNLFEGYCGNYESKLSPELNTQIEETVTYGYWLGEQVFKDRLQQVYDFLSLFKIDIKRMGLPKDREPHDSLDDYLDILPARIDLKVGKYIETKFITKIKV